jgi:hypothetical protein
MPQLLAQSGGLILGNCDGALLKRSGDFRGVDLFFVVGHKPFGLMGIESHGRAKK